MKYIIENKTALIITHDPDIFKIVDRIIEFNDGVIISDKRIKGSCGGISENCTCSNTEKIKCKLKMMFDTKST